MAQIGAIFGRKASRMKCLILPLKNIRAGCRYFLSVMIGSFDCLHHGSCDWPIVLLRGLFLGFLLQTKSKTIPRQTWNFDVAQPSTIRLSGARLFQAALLELWHFSFVSGFACRLKLVFFMKDLFSIDDAMLQNRAGLLVREVNCHPGQVLLFHKPREERQSYWNWASIC